MTSLTNLQAQATADPQIHASAGPVSALFSQQGVTSFSEALEWAHRLPYGRNTDRADFMCIFRENCGTCSTKHAALYALCQENGIKEAQLIVVICKLDTELDPRVEGFLHELGVDFFPEAHCFIHYAGQDIDVTFPDQTPTVKVSILHRYSIQAEQIGDYKLALHHDYLRQWLKEKGLSYSFDELWSKREAWIASLCN